MPDFGRNQEPSLDEIHRSDSFIDALAGGHSAVPADQADAALAALLGGWRDENRWPPETGLISESQAIAALDAGLAENRSGSKRDKWAPTPSGALGSAANRSRRGLSVVGAAAAAMLAIGGFGAVVSGAGPGDSLYGLRTMLFGAPKQVRDDQVALAAKTEMQQVQEMISRGDWQQAEQKLVAVSNQVSSIGDDQQKQQLLDQFNDLSAKVVERDPEATAAPGVTYTAPPSATELTTIPVSTPPASESATSPAESGSSSSIATTPTSVPSTTVPSTAATSVPPTSAASTSAAATSIPSTSAAGTSVPSTSAASTSATQQSQATTTPTSAKPSTSVTTTPSASAPASSSAATSATTTAAPAAAATSTTSAGTTATGTTATGTTAAGTTATGTTATGTATSSAVTTASPTSSGASSRAVATTTSAPTQASATTVQAPPSQQQVVTPVTTTVVIPLPVPAG